MNHSSNLSNTIFKKHKSKENVIAYLRELAKGIYKTRYLQLLALPGLIYFLVFEYVPMYGVIIAFKDYKVQDGIMGSDWVGFANFIKFFKNPYFWRLIRNTLLINIYQLLLVFPIPIAFALLLNELRNKYYKRFVQTVSYLPHFISLPAIIGILVMFLSPTDGIINKFIVEFLGRESIYFMADPSWFRPLYIISSIWTGIGWGAIIYLAALSNVDQSLYEAAGIDGATRFQMMRHISIPSIAPTIIIMLLLNIGKIMSLGSEKVLLMQSPLSYETSDVISTFVYRRGLQYAEYSYTTAVSVFNSIINIIILVIANRVSKKATETSLW